MNKFKSAKRQDYKIQSRRHTLNLCLQKKLRTSQIILEELVKQMQIEKELKNQIHL